MMNSDKFFEKYHADQLQKVLDEDMQELATEEAQAYDASGGQAPMRKMRPAYEDGDVFEWKRNQQILRTQRRKQMERESMRGVQRPIQLGRGEER